MKNWGVTFAKWMDKCGQCRSRSKYAQLHHGKNLFSKPKLSEISGLPAEACVFQNRRQMKRPAGYKEGRCCPTERMASSCIYGAHGSHCSGCGVEDSHVV
ncbi:uncharacterized protein LOC116483391 isoform X2 [Hylobates moloch]|uniref:uncharacterized protein LOC116483391 isoform X2 n=1 Tax=Hylobates moloch TaxID=81572 RepID=UPI002675F295|nr:uncharacterized protein LOC116483391 isoform X2 [Hylobates moloch]